MTKTIIKPAKSPATVGPYNHAVRVGDLLFCAGQIPLDPANSGRPKADVRQRRKKHGVPG
jgi:2-iminobutanoate/2-iminopropanoate deaminase